MTQLRTLTSSTMQVLDSTSLSHPAALLLLEAASVHTLHGCGATMLTCLSIELIHGGALFSSRAFVYPQCCAAHGQLPKPPVHDCTH